MGQKDPADGTTVQQVAVVPHSYRVLRLLHGIALVLSIAVGSLVSSQNRLVCD